MVVDSIEKNGTGGVGRLVEKKTSLHFFFYIQCNNGGVEGLGRREERRRKKGRG